MDVTYCSNIQRKRKRSDDDDYFFKTVGLISDETLLFHTSKLPKINGRAQMVFSLMKAYNLLNNFRLLPSTPATSDDLCNFHSSDYIEYLQKINNMYTPDDDTDLEYGIGYDCPPLDGIYDYCCAVAGSTVTAARALLVGDVDIVINWCGGWHHAQRDEAEGFCYVNDVALGILEMRKSFQNILYVDLDIHHGNGVENCFAYTKRVMSVSFHLFEPGFYPGTGSIEEVGAGKGSYYSVNVPLKSGATDALYTYVFDNVIESVLRKFKTDAIVVQCGADGLSGDPVGQSFNLSHKSYGYCLKKLIDLNKPTLVLGGGGYHLPNTARCWTYLSSVIIGLELPDDIPEHEYFNEYGPTFELSVPVSYRKDSNSQEYISQLLYEIQRNLEAAA